MRDLKLSSEEKILSVQIVVSKHPAGVGGVECLLLQKPQGNELKS